MSFREIDVDAYDEDVLPDSETDLYDPDPREPTQILSDTKQKQLAVRSTLYKRVSLSLYFALVFVTD
jgi:actin related protein 2/3 complex subunit 5